MGSGASRVRSILMRIRRPAALAFAAVLAVGLAACGDDGGGGDDVALEEVDTTTSTTTADDEGAETTTGGLGDLSGGCAAFQQAAIAFGAAFGGGADADLDDLADAMDAFAAEVPDELTDDVEVLAEAYRQFAEAFADVDVQDPNAFSDPEVQARLEEAGQIFESPEVTEATANVEAFTSENCPEAG